MNAKTTLKIIPDIINKTNWDMKGGKQRLIALYYELKSTKCSVAEGKIIILVRSIILNGMLKQTKHVFVSLFNADDRLV